MKRSDALAVLELSAVIARHVHLAQSRVLDPKLPTRVIRAAAKIGIPGVEAVVTEPDSWDRVLYGTHIFRQSEFSALENCEWRDLGYIKREQFNYNPYAFTSERLDQFLNALERNRVEYYPHQDSGLLALDVVAEQRLWRQREVTAFYR